MTSIEVTPSQVMAARVLVALNDAEGLASPPLLVQLSHVDLDAGQDSAAGPEL